MFAAKRGTPVRLVNQSTHQVEPATYYGMTDDQPVFLFRKRSAFAQQQRDGKVVEMRNPNQTYVLEGNEAA